MLIDKAHLVGLSPGDVINFTGISGTVSMVILKCTDCGGVYLESAAMIEVKRPLWNSHCDTCAEIQLEAGGKDVVQGA